MNFKPKKYMVMISGNPLVVDKKYNWSRQDCEEILASYIRKIQLEINATNDPTKINIYQDQLENLSIEEVVHH